MISAGEASVSAFSTEPNEVVSVQTAASPMRPRPQTTVPPVCHSAVASSNGVRWGAAEPPLSSAAVKNEFPLDGPELEVTNYKRELHRVIASAERHEMEIASDVVAAITDHTKATDCARLEVLHSHLNTLRTVQQQALHMQRQAEAKAVELTAELTDTKRTLTLQKQDSRRLRWQLSRRSHDDTKISAMSAFSTAGSDARHKLSLIADQEKAAFQAQLDEANALAEDMSGRIRETRAEFEAKLVNQAVQVEQDREVAHNKAKAVEEGLRKEIARLKKRLKKGSNGRNDSDEEDDFDIPPGGSIGPGGVVLDANGNPVLGKDGKPIVMSDKRVPPGGSIGAGGIILGADGKPVLGADGKPMYATPRRRKVEIPPGGSIGPGGMVLDANGKPVLGKDGKPLRITDPRVPPGGSIGAGGVILDANGKPVLGKDGKPMISDPRIPPGGSIGEGGVILGADGRPLLGADGQPMFAEVSEEVLSELLDFEDETPDWKPPSSAVGSARNGSPKRQRNSEIVPAGRMVTFSQLRAKDVPDMDMRGKADNISDPYLLLQAIDEKGNFCDEARTSWLKDVRSPHWKETLRLFVPDQDVAGQKTRPFNLQITLMDHNKKTDTLIGDVKIALKVGAGKVKIEIPSRSPSPMRPFVYFKYEATPQMYFEQVEFVRVAQEESINDGDDDD